MQAGAIKYKLHHITLYLPAEPFGYNWTPVRYSPGFSGISGASTWIIFQRRCRRYGLQVKCNFPFDWTVATLWHPSVYFTHFPVISSGKNQLKSHQNTSENLKSYDSVSEDEKEYVGRVFLMAEQDKKCA